MMDFTDIEKGIILDHIPPGDGIKLFNQLMLRDNNYPIELFINIPSDSMGKKDVIKIATDELVSIDFLDLIHKKFTINMVSNNKILRLS